MLSLVLLILYVFLPSAATYELFSVDAKLVAFIGLMFCLVAVVEMVLFATHTYPLSKLLRRRAE